MLKFDKALRNYTLLNAEYTHYFLNRFKGLPKNLDAFPDKIYRAAGRAPGVFAFLGMDFQSSYTIIILSNFDSSVAMNLSKEIVKILNIK